MQDYTQYSDDQLAVLLKAKDHAAFTQIYKRYWAVLFRHCRKMLRDDDAAADVVQDLFTHLWTKAKEITLTTSLKGYLYTAVRNKTLDHINRSRLTDTYLASLDDFINKGEYVTDDHVRHNEFATLIEQEISRLPDKMRRTFELSRKSNLSYKEIAKELNIADDTVKKQISKALKILRIRFGATIIMIMHTFP